MSVDKFSLFLILLAEFLYLESAASGIRSNDSYAVYADTVRRHYVKSHYSDVTYAIVKLINGLCHCFGTYRVESRLRSFIRIG